MTIIKTFVRGGQTSLHSFRMTGQLFRIMFFCSCLIVLLAVGWQLYSFSKEQPLQMKAALWHLRAVHFDAWRSDEHVYSIARPSGQIVQMSAVELRNGPAFVASLELMKAEIWSGARYGSVIAVGCVLIMLVYFFIRGQAYSGTRRVRGAELVSRRQLSKLAQKTYRREDTQPWQLANVNWPKGGETLHTLITGSTGSGKTVAMLDLMDQIESRNGKAVIYDKMGSFVPYFYRPNRDVILNPFDERSADWDIFAEARTQTDFETMAAALIPHFKDTNDPFWTSAARQLFASGATSMWKTGEHSVHALVDLLMRMDLKDLAKRMEGTVAQAIVNPDAGKTALSVRTVLTTHLRPLSFLPPIRTPFSIRQWVEQDRPGFLFLTSNAATHEARRAMIATQFELALVSLLSQPRSENRRLWFIIDELPTLHQIPSLASGLRESRQFGGALVLGTQVFSELRDIYGRESATTIAGNCNTRLMLNSPDMDTADWLSQNLGRIEVERTDENISYGAVEIRDGVGLSRREQLQRLVLPSDIMRLEPLQGYVKMPHNLPAAKVTLRPRDRELIAQPFVARRDDDSKTEDAHESERSSKFKVSQSNKVILPAAKKTPDPNQTEQEWGQNPPGGPPKIADIDPRPEPPPHAFVPSESDTHKGIAEKPRQAFQSADQSKKQNTPNSPTVTDKPIRSHGTAKGADQKPAKPTAATKKNAHSESAQQTTSQNATSNLDALFE